VAPDTSLASVNEAVAFQRVLAMSLASMDCATPAASMDRDTWIRMFCDVLHRVTEWKHASVMKVFSL
jgi:hypothetical protein